MQIDAGLQWVWRDYFREVINLAVVIIILSAMMSRFFNHYSATGEERPWKQKVRNTWKFSAALAIVWFWAVRLDFLHSQFDRLGIKNVLFASGAVLIVAGDWLGFILWSMANYHNPLNLRSGWRGWLVDGRDKVLAWVKRTAIALKNRIPGSARKVLALLVLTVTMLACVSIVVTSTPPREADPDPQGTAGALNETYEAWATETARPTPTVTYTRTPAPTDTPTATFTSSIFEVTACPTGEICEILP